jgi:DnaJ-class molecular chaperone
LASCDQPLNDHELEAVREIAEALGFPIEKHTSLRRLLGLSRPASGKSAQPERFRREGRDRSAPPAPHQWCYDTLGCSEKDSDETVKRAYRRLAATLHPDKHAGESREPDSLLAHQRDFQRLQDAYTILKRLRPALR